VAFEVFHLSTAIIQIECKDPVQTLLRNCWCHIIVLNVHAPTGNKTDNVKESLYEELECVFDKFPKHHMKILLGDFNVKVSREDISKPTIGNESLHKIINDDLVRLVNFATSKNSESKVRCSHITTSINILGWMSPEGKTHNQIDHILIDRRRHSYVFYVLSYRAADCDIDHYQMVAKVRERLAVKKQRSHSFLMERSNLKKLNEVEDKEKFHVEVSNSFAALEDLDAVVEINSAWEMTGENINISAKVSVGYFELKKHKPWFNEGCSKLLY
jgi:hypothetical protein